MNRRERFLETMTFGSPDRPASGDYFAYESTRERWEKEGLPPGVDLNEYFDMDFDPFRWRIEVNWNYPLPPYERVVLEETDDYEILRRAGGETVKVLKNAPPPAMPHWLRYPVTSREEWSDFKRRFDPGTPGRLPSDLGRRASDEYASREKPLGAWLGGTFGIMRNWWGVEEISVLFYDSPALIEEMVETLTHHSIALLDGILAEGVQLDWVFFWEDMAYNHGPLLSPQLYQKYCMPYYRTMMEKVREAGIPAVLLDSDGKVDELIPLWLDVGITVMHPMEVASGMDVIQARKKYGRRIAFFGGIDKRALAGTREEIKAEVMPKLEFCLNEGGFIPACDHGIPPDISFENYCYYRELVNSHI